MAVGMVKEIARFVTWTQFEDLPPEAIQETRRMLLDSIGCAIAGLSTDKGKHPQKIDTFTGGNTRQSDGAPYSMGA